MRAPARQRSRYRRFVYPLVAVACLAALWELGAMQAQSLLIPRFTSTAAATAELLSSGDLWAALAITHQALAIGLVLSLLVGLPLGFLMGRYVVAERISDVYLNILLVLPTGAIIPLLVMWLGIGLAARVVVVFVFTVVMVVVNVRAGVRQVDPALIEMAKSLGARERQVWRRILLPGSAPGVMAGVRIGLSRAIQGAVIVELLMVPVGVGGLLLDFKAFYRPDFMYGTVLIIVLEALVLVSLAGRLEHATTHWAKNPALRAGQ